MYPIELCGAAGGCKVVFLSRSNLSSGRIYARTSILIFSAFSAACAVDAVAVAPGRFGTEITYCPLDSWMLAE